MDVKRILAPTDLSPYAGEGLKLAAGLAQQFGAELVLFHALSPREVRRAEERPPPGNYIDEIFKRARTEAMDHFDSLATGLEHRLVRALVASGSPEIEIIRAARSQDCDLIVMSTHGRTGLSHFLMGSVAERVVRTSDRPVMTVRPAGHVFQMP